jgi:hypothetical protein
MNRQISLLLSLVLTGCLLAGCGDDEGIPGCQEGTRKDCTLAGGGVGEMVCSGGIWSACQEKSCSVGATKSCVQDDGSPGQMECKDGKWTACGPIPGQCTNDTYQKCTTAGGKDGFQRCVNGQWGPCEEEAACKDGQQQSCTTACGTGTEVCVNGMWQNCTAPEPEAEKCDGVDNDCNGEIDETCACVHGKCEPCYTGPANTNGVGACKEGQKCCDKGVWGPCTNEVLPASQEDCTDNVDNDCDGTVNDGCTCTVGQEMPCGTNVGECTVGKKICQISGGQPVWGECIGAKLPQPEKDFGCDGKDNDCDGVIDNGLPADQFEGNDTCALARKETVEDSFASDPPTEWTMTLYPSGDVDYIQIIAQETSLVIIPPCVPWTPWSPGDPQCNYFDVEIVQAGVTGVQYQFSILTGKCASPTKTFTSTSQQTIQWDGECGLDDSQTFWLKVEPTASSAPTFSCNPYKLKVQYWRVNEECKPATP